MIEDLARELSHCWRFWARPEQLAPPGVWSTWVVLAGRGWGKTKTGAEWVREKVEEGEERIALTGATAADVRDVMVLGESGLLAAFPDHQRPKYEPSKRRVTFHTGAIATLYSAAEPDRLRGPQHGKAWSDEVAAWQHIEETRSNLSMGLRLGDNPQELITTTPRPIDVLRQLVEDSHTIGNGVRVTRGRTLDNAANLPPQFLSDVQRAYGGTRLGRQELEGEILEPSGGLFKPEWFLHVDAAPKCSRVVVALDPAITTRNDETGIIVVGRAGDRGYVLEDLSGTMSPEEWARRAVDAAQRHGAQAIVAETNRGGDLVATTIRQFDRRVVVREVRANRGKDTRAEPIAALYEQRRISHVGRFAKLERQMVEWAPTSQEAQRARRQATSPDRMDALVWGLTDLGFHLGVVKLAPLSTPLPQGVF